VTESGKSLNLYYLRKRRRTHGNGQKERLLTVFYINSSLEGCSKMAVIGKTYPKIFHLIPTIKYVSPVSLTFTNCKNCYNYFSVLASFDKLELDSDLATKAQKGST